MKNKQCQQCSKTYKIESEDLEFYKRIEVPEPNFCPECRARRRLSVRNHWNYYERTCDMCKKHIISVYDPERTKNVYCNDCWWGDKWDAKDYAQDFDFNKTLAEQFKELHEEVPKLAMMNDNGTKSENCEYSNDFAFGKNVYMVAAAWYDENCMYSFQLNHSKDCIDCLYFFDCELCYDCSSGYKCYGCEHCHEIHDSNDCIFGYDLKNCNDCILCANLRNKQYCIWNKQYSKKEFEIKKKQLNLSDSNNRQKLHDDFMKFLLKIPRKFASFINCESSSGNHLKNCKNAKYCFEFPGINNGKYLVSGDGATDSYDLYCVGHCELCYDSLTSDDSYYVLFSNNCWKCEGIFYSDNCHSSKNLFACANMKKEKNSILNKQYSEEDYKKLKKKIIEHMKKTKEWGNFLDPKASLFYYNETAANEFYPLKKEQAVSLGYSWASFAKATEAKKKKDVHICVDCDKNFKLIKQELEFYKKRSIPHPEKCMMCRYQNRRKIIGPHKLWHRQCMKPGCDNNFETTYSPDRKELVYCEKCYNKETY